MNYWKTDLIRLRAVEPSDAQHFLKWHEDTELSRHMDFLSPPQSSEAIKTFIEKETLNKLEGDRYFWIIEDHAGAVVGHIDTRCNTRHRNFEYGVSIAARHRRMSYASDAINKVLDYYFNQLRYNKVMAGVHGDNEASKQLHERLGFRLEGTLTEMVFTNGNFIDMAVYGKTAAEFNAR